MPARGKRALQEIDPASLSEPPMTPEDWEDYRKGWRLFNEGQYWHAHEAWEAVWKRHTVPGRLFFQGIIQLAAAYHLLTVKRRYGGMMRNFEKAEEKLRLFPSRFLGVERDRLLAAMDDARSEIARIGPDHLERFSPTLLPRVPC